MPLFRKTAPDPSFAGGPSSTRQLSGLTVAARLDATPGVERLPVEAMRIYRHSDFLDGATCDALIALIDANRRPSTLLAERANSDLRTSDSCDMDRASDAIRPTDGKIAGLLGIDPLQAETMQGQRYAPGQRFRAHHDFFHEGQPYWETMKRAGGQRTWTAMVFLNDVAEGGATWFPSAGLRIVPKRGTLLAWNNMREDGSPNPDTLHEGMAVGEGVKYIVTKWFREHRWVPA